MRATSGSAATRSSCRVRHRGGRPRRARSQHGRGGGLAGRASIPTRWRGGSSRRARRQRHDPGRARAACCAQSTAFFSALLFGIGALGLVIGGLSLSNTVTAAVFERIRDFGIKRALGRHRRCSCCARSSARRSGCSLSGGAARAWCSPSPSAPLVDAQAARRPAALPLLAAPARLRARLRGRAGRLAAAYATAPHRAPVARRGHPPRRLRCCVRALGLSKTFRGPAAARPVLHGVDLDVKAGEFVAVVGRVRARGKSTLLNLLGLLEPLDAGEIWFDDVRVSPLSRRAQCRVRGPLHRLRLPVVPADRRAHRAGERAARRALRGRARGRGAGARRAGLMDRLGVAHRARSLPGAALGRRAAAGGLLPRGPQRSAARAGR